MGRFDRKVSRHTTSPQTHRSSLRARTEALVGAKKVVHGPTHSFPQMAGLPSMSDQLLSFLGELMDTDDTSTTRLKNALSLGIACWNAGHGSDQDVDKLLADIEQMASGAGMNQEDVEEMHSVALDLVERRRGEFSYDPRMMVDFEVIPTGPKKFRINVSGLMIPPDGGVSDR